MSVKLWTTLASTFALMGCKPFGQSQDMTKLASAESQIAAYVQKDFRVMPVGQFFQIRRLTNEGVPTENCLVPSGTSVSFINKCDGIAHWKKLKRQSCDQAEDFLDPNDQEIARIQYVGEPGTNDQKCLKQDGNSLIPHPQNEACGSDDPFKLKFHYVPESGSDLLHKAKTMDGKPLSILGDDRTYIKFVFVKDVSNPKTVKFSNLEAPKNIAGQNDRAYRFQMQLVGGDQNGECLIITPDFQLSTEECSNPGGAVYPWQRLTENECSEDFDSRQHDTGMVKFRLGDVCLKNDGGTLSSVGNCDRQDGTQVLKISDQITSTSDQALAFDGSGSRFQTFTPASRSGVDQNGVQGTAIKAWNFDTNYSEPLISDQSLLNSRDYFSDGYSVVSKSWLMSIEVLGDDSGLKGLKTTYFDGSRQDVHIHGCQSCKAVGEPIIIADQSSSNPYEKIPVGVTNKEEMKKYRILQKVEAISDGSAIQGLIFHVRTGDQVTRREVKTSRASGLSPQPLSPRMNYVAESDTAVIGFYGTVGQNIKDIGVINSDLVEYFYDANQPNALDEATGTEALTQEPSRLIGPDGVISGDEASISSSAQFFKDVIPSDPKRLFFLNQVKITAGDEVTIGEDVVYSGGGTSIGGSKYPVNYTKRLANLGFSIRYDYRDTSGARLDAIGNESGPLKHTKNMVKLDEQTMHSEYIAKVYFLPASSDPEGYWKKPESYDHLDFRKNNGIAGLRFLIRNIETNHARVVEYKADRKAQGSWTSISERAGDYAISGFFGEEDDNGIYKLGVYTTTVGCIFKGKWPLFRPEVQERAKAKGQIKFATGASGTEAPTCYAPEHYQEQQDEFTTPVVGESIGSSSGGPHPFDDFSELSVDAVMTKFEIKSGDDQVRGVRITYDIYGLTRTFEHVGSGGGSWKSLSLADGEFITKVGANTGDCNDDSQRICKLRVFTNRGREFAAGKSHKDNGDFIGINTGGGFSTKYSTSEKGGYRVHSFFGKYGEALNRIGMTWLPQ